MKKKFVMSCASKFFHFKTRFKRMIATKIKYYTITSGKKDILKNINYVHRTNRTFYSNEKDTKKKMNGSFFT